MKRNPYQLFKRKIKAKNGKSRSVYYCRFWDESEQKYIKTLSTGKTNINEAREFAEKQIETGAVKTTEFFPEFLENFWKPDSPYVKSKNLRGRELSEGYIENMGNAVKRYVKPYQPLRTKTIPDLTPADIEKFIIYWVDEQGKGIPAINTALRAIKTALSYHCKQNRISNPLEDVKVMKESPEEREILTIEEMRALVTVEYHDPRYLVAVHLGCFTGLRIGEVRGLRWQSVDLARGVIHIVNQVPVFKKGERAPKSGSVGVLPLPSFMIDELRQLGEGSPFGMDGFVIHSADINRPIDSTGLIKGFRNILEKIGIPKEIQRPKDPDYPERRGISFHCLRHSFVSHSRGAGLSALEAQLLARHRDPAMTSRYTHGAAVIDFDKARVKWDTVLQKKQDHKDEVK